MALSIFASKVARQGRHYRIMKIYNTFRNNINFELYIDYGN